MKRIFLLIIILLMFVSNVYASDMDYDSLYDAAMPFPSRLYNDVDPFEDEDNIRYAWSPYPLFRTSAFLYFKDYTIEPGYYSIVPRVLQGNDYVFFKQGGKVKFIIPVAKKERTPVNFYEANLPKVHQTKWQKFTSGVKKKFYNAAKDSMRVSPPNSLVKVDVEVKYITLTLYYGEDKHILLFRRSPY